MFRRILRLVQSVFKSNTTGNFTTELMTDTRNAIETDTNLPSADSMANTGNTKRHIITHDNEMWLNHRLRHTIKSATSAKPKMLFNLFQFRSQFIDETDINDMTYTLEANRLKTSATDLLNVGGGNNLYIG